MTKPSAEFVQSILARESVTDAIEAVAAYEESPLSARLRAEEALRVAVEITQVPGCREIDESPDGGGYVLASIAIAAVKTLDPKKDKHHLRHVLVSWFGPTHVPNNLRFSWEIKDKKGSKMNLATPPVLHNDKIVVQGDPSAWREALKDPQPGTITTIPEITDARGAELVGMQNTMAAVDAAVMNAAEVYTALGRIQAATFFARIGNISAAQFAVQVRKGKKFKGMPYDDKDGNRKYISTFDEFCEVFLGKTGRYVRDLVNNLHTLGPDLYEAAEKTGFRATDYAALKALPQVEQELVKQALAAESKEQVLDILQDLAARNQTERAAAKKHAEDLKGDLDARDKLLTEKTEKNDRLSLELAKLKALPPNERARLQLEQEQAAAERINAACVKAEGESNLFLAEVADVLAVEGLSTHARDYALNTVRFLCECFAEFIADHNIDVDFMGMSRPVWRRDLAAQDLGVKESAE